MPRYTPGPVLGLETSCDETAAAIVDRGVVLAHRVASQVPIHQRFGGVVPEVAARNHLLTVLPVVQAVLEDARLGAAALAGIAVTSRPGLIGALLVGVQTAKALAWAHQLPLIGVDHIHAHVWAAHLRPPGLDAPQWSQPKVPFGALAVSGGHTSLYAVHGPSDMRLLGRSLDDAAGEAFDKLAKLLGLPYPGGPEIERRAALGNPKRFILPRGMLGRDDGAYSFSGLKTAARLAAEAARQSGGDSGDWDEAVTDLCASFQAAAVEQLVRVTMAGLKRHGLRQLVLAGGVAANQSLRSGLAAACARQRVQFFPVPTAYCSDNGAMVAALGQALLEAGTQDDPRVLDAQATGEVRRAAAP